MNISPFTLLPYLFCHSMTSKIARIQFFHSHKEQTFPSTESRQAEGAGVAQALAE
jgi:hypothetical protein